MNSSRIRVAILDSNPKSRKHLRKLLRKEADLDVVTEAEPGLAGVKEIEEQKPDVILLDNSNPFTEGLETTEMIVSRFPDTRIIVLSMDSKNTMLPLHSKHTMTASTWQYPGDPGCNQGRPSARERFNSPWHERCHSIK